MRLRQTAALAATLVIVPGIALARPTLSLTMSAATVTRTADGREVDAPLGASTALRPGTVVRYTIDARNAGPDAARALRPQALVPRGTAFVEASDRGPAAASVEFSVDGKTWSAHPTIVVRDPSGAATTVPAPASRYTAIRWVLAQPLAAGTGDRFSYEVAVR